MAVAVSNARIFNETLRKLKDGDRFLVPNETFYVMGGIQAEGVKNVIIQIDGTIIMSDDIKSWPRDGEGNVRECLEFRNFQNVTITSKGVGTIDGQGRTWWGIPFIGTQICIYLYTQRERERESIVVPIDILSSVGPRGSFSGTLS